MNLVQVGGVYFAPSEVATARLGYVGTAYGREVVVPLEMDHALEGVFDRKALPADEKVNYAVIVQLRSGEKLTQSGFESREDADNWIRGNLL